MTETGQKWAKVVSQMGRKWPEMAENGLKMAETGRMLAVIVQKMSQIGRKWSKMVENWHKWAAKWATHGQKLPIMADNGQSYFGHFWPVWTGYDHLCTICVPFLTLLVARK